ncbi:tetratricopeptide repeat protein, partial [archaeon]|nr:tetratricopeptide repeat protein [archaeon]
MRKIIVLLCAVALVAGCATPFKQKRAISKPLVTIARERIQQDNIQGGLLELRKALEVNPDDPEIYYTFAFAYWKTEKYDKALENTEKAIDYADNLGLENPGLKSDAYNLKGSLLVLKGQKEKAIKAFEKALEDELYPRPEYTCYNLASVYLDLKRYPEAQKAAMKGLDYNPHYAPAWKILGQVYVELGDENGAIDALNNAVKEFNGYTEAYWDLAQIYIRKGNK